MDTIDHVERFKVEYQFRLDPSTIQQYTASVRQLLHHVQKPVENVTKQDIRNWFISLEGQGYRLSTIATKLRGLRKFFAYCEEDEIVPINPTKGIPYPRTEEKLPTYLTPPELAILRDTVRGKPFEAAMVEVLVTTGVRITELRHLQQSAIDWTERSILVFGKYDKERVVLFTQACSELLQAYLDSRTDEVPYVFINQMRTREVGEKLIYHHFDTYSAVLGRNITPHTLRYTYAVNMIQSGMDEEEAQELLGHDRPETTAWYTKLYSHDQKNKYDEWT
ncbi:tyrosine-type recombinase/integrase [Sporosarcina cascadiensis]|uniref:tyrosine-type recombinase/integrase n=1 Tax=Sporosarcina cascadiensis TaxID=2660747 RepID=UPI00129B4868|nr:tyrosine-type recombinase/integrase [Sporosarcina cascadiensis]